MKRERAWRMRVLAVVSGLLAVSAMVTPTAVAEGSGGDGGRAGAAGSAAAEIAEIQQAEGAPEGARTPGAIAASIAGGEEITSSGARCTLGFNVQNSAGTKYALTAGHCTNIGSSWSIGTRVGTSFPGNDYGMILHSVPANADGRVYLQNGTYQDITTAGNPPAGQPVCISSPAGVRCGNITGLNMTINHGGGTVSGLGRLDICPEPGDGGAPVFSGSTAVGIVSGGSGNCSSGGVTYYQPVGEALSAYGVNVY